MVRLQPTGVTFASLRSVAGRLIAATIDTMRTLDVSMLVKGQRLTVAAQSFLLRMQEDVDFLEFMAAQIARANDKVGHVGASESHDSGAALLKHASIVDEMFFCRVADSFLIFVSDLLRDILRSKPNILAATERIRTERLLRASSIQELIDEIIDEQVASLSFLGFRELREWFSKHGLDLCTEKSDEDVLIEAIAIRNLITHARGRVDARFKKAVPARSEPVGAALRLEKKEIEPAMRVIAKTVAFADNRAAEKFKLPVAPYIPG
jgi:hypothetical protein